MPLPTSIKVKELEIIASKSRIIKNKYFFGLSYKQLKEIKLHYKL